MRRLSPRVNVIPVIGKSDTLTMSELRDFKQRVRLKLTRVCSGMSVRRDGEDRVCSCFCLSVCLFFGACHGQVMEDIEYYSIPVYNFPFDEEEDDEETIIENSELRVRAVPPYLSHMQDRARLTTFPRYTAISALYNGSGFLWLVLREKPCRTSFRLHLLNQRRTS